MQTAQDEGDSRASGTRTGEASGLDQDSGEVELLSTGWKTAIGKCTSFRVTRHETMDTPLVFERIDADIVLGHTASLLVVQGLQLQNLFPANAFFRSAGLRVSAGPYYFLAGKLSAPIDPPTRLSGVVLAHVVRMPDGMKQAELLGALLAATK